MTKRLLSSSRKLARNFDCGNLGCSQCRQANILLFSFTAPERVTPRWCLHLNEPTICKQQRDCALQTVTRPLLPRLHCRYTSYCVTSLEIAIPRHLTLSVRRVIEPPKKLLQGMTCFLARGLSINVFPQLAHGVTCSKPGCAGDPELYQPTVWQSSTWWVGS